jgi:hypothetical protein
VSASYLSRRFLRGDEPVGSETVAYLATALWEYEELAHGVNWFRRILGMVVAIILIVRVAGAFDA